jgi:hypothetical protein
MHHVDMSSVLQDGGDMRGEYGVVEEMRCAMIGSAQSKRKKDAISSHISDFVEREMMNAEW